MPMKGYYLRRSPLPNVSSQQSLDDDYIPPNVVELSVILVDANFAKTAGDDQLPAGVIFDQDTRDQLVETGLLGGRDESLGCKLSGAQAAGLSSDVDRELRDAG